MKKEQIEQMVLKAQKGDSHAFAQLFDHFFDKIFRYINFRVNPNEAEDLVSEIFLKVVEKIHQYSPQKSVGFNAWIFRIAHNMLVDFYRKKQEIVGIDTDEDEGGYYFEIEDENPTPDDATNRLFDNKRVLEVLKKLSPSHREILELKYLEGFSNTEIAKITDKSEGNIRVIQLRALREMRKYWPHGEG